MKRLSSFVFALVVIAAAVMSTACRGTSFSVAKEMVQGRIPGEVIASIPIKGALLNMVFLVCTEDGHLDAVSINLENAPESAVSEPFEIDGISCGDRLKAKKAEMLNIKEAARAFYRANPDTAKGFKVDWNAIDQELREVGRY